MIVEAEKDPAWENPFQYAQTARYYLNNNCKKLVKR
jgi:hypothetical protein